MKTFFTSTFLISMTVTSLAFAQTPAQTPETDGALPTTETPEAPVWNLETAANLELEGQFVLNRNVRLRLPHSRSTTPFINLYLNESNGKSLDRQFSKISENFAEKVKDLRASFFKQRISKEELDAKSLEAWNRLNTSFNELDAKYPHCNVTVVGLHKDDLDLETGMKLQFEAPIKESADLMKAGKMEFNLKISPTAEDAPNQLRVTCPKDMTLDKLSLALAQHLKAQGQFTAFTDDDQILTCNSTSCQTTDKQSGN
ncbi:MAG: hypothetical protein ACXWC9_00640 [Pseudobdellovibrionaceae bacterium]